MRRLALQLAAEFIGTFLVVFIVIGSVCADPWLKAASQPLLGTIGVALAYGFAVAVSTEVFAPISGGHLNPAISLGRWVSRRMGAPRLIAYFAVQMAGAIAAARVLASILPESALQAADLGTPQLASSLTRAQGMVLEAILTFVVAFIFCRTELLTGRASGWAVGAAVMAAVLVAGPLTGAALNPARAFAAIPVVHQWANQGVWWVGPLSGGVAGGWLAHAFGKPADGD